MSILAEAPARGPANGVHTPLQMITSNNHAAQIGQTHEGNAIRDTQAALERQCSAVMSN